MCATNAAPARFNRRMLIEPLPVESPSVRELGVGDVFAGHRIDGVAGRGGMGVVYRATQLDLDRTVALKVIAAGLLDEPGIRARFVRESKLAASIDHPNVIPIFYAGEERGVAYIAMRYVPGDDLRSLVRREGPLAAQRAARIVVETAAALDAAHAAGLVHRDVKPANVLLGPEDHAYLTDFGLTKDARSLGADATRSGQWVGTLDYVAPEQIRAERVDARADVYALGCVLHFALTGRAPFDRGGEEARLWAHLVEPPPRPSEAVPGLPGALDDVVARALAKEPADRFPSAGDLGRAAVAAAAGRVEARGGRIVARGAAAPAAAPAATADAPDEDATVPAGRAPAAIGAGHSGETTAGTAAMPASRPRIPAPLGGAIVALVAAVLAVGAVTLLGGGAPSHGGAVRAGGPVLVPPTTAAHVTGTARTGPRPNALALAGGRVWVGSFPGDRLTAVDPGTGRALPALAAHVGVGTADLAVRGDRVWVMLSRQRRIAVLDARTGRPAAPPIALPGTPVAIAAAEDAVWVGLSTGDRSLGHLVRIDPATGALAAATPIAVPGGIVRVVAARGALWVLNRTVSRLVKVDPERGVPVSHVALPGRDTGALAYGAGYLWVTVRDSDYLVRVDPHDGRPASIAVDRGPAGVAVAGGRVWVANTASSTVTQVDARAGRVIGDPIPVPLNPYAVAADAGGAWVTSLERGVVVRIAR
jgi:DNA-binding beta-propeller fold protein YncE